MAFAKLSRSKLHGLFAPDAAGSLSLKTADKQLHSLALNAAKNFYIDDWAVSAYEHFGLNDNADGFELEELKRSHGSFVGSWVCLDHDNDHVSKKVGNNLDAVLTPEHYVRVVMCVDRQLAEKRHPGIEQKIAQRIITDSSMGAIVQRSKCTIPTCANIASDESEFCDHVTALRGRTLCDASTKWVPVVCGELNRGVTFFENSIITDSEGADCNAKLLHCLSIRAAVKTASARGTSVSIDAGQLLRELGLMARTASTTEKVMLIAIIDRLERAL